MSVFKFCKLFVLSDLLSLLCPEGGNRDRQRENQRASQEWERWTEYEWDSSRHGGYTKWHTIKNCCRCMQISFSVFLSLWDRHIHSFSRCTTRNIPFVWQDSEIYNIIITLSVCLMHFTQHYGKETVVYFTVFLATHYAAYSSRDFMSPLCLSAPDFISILGWGL